MEAPSEESFHLDPPWNPKKLAHCHMTCCLTSHLWWNLSVLSQHRVWSNWFWLSLMEEARRPAVILFVIPNWLSKLVDYWTSEWNQQFHDLFKVQNHRSSSAPEHPTQSRRPNPSQSLNMQTHRRDLLARRSVTAWSSREGPAGLNTQEGAGNSGPIRDCPSVCVTDALKGSFNQCDSWPRRQ